MACSVQSSTSQSQRTHSWNRLGVFLLRLAMPATLPNTNVTVCAIDAILAATGLLDILARLTTTVRVIHGPNGRDVIWQFVVLDAFNAGVLGSQAGIF